MGTKLGEGSFVLQITISKRAAFIVAVALLLVIPGIAGATHIFTDVVDGSTHAEGIEYVADVGVTSGCGDGSTYCPNDSVSRAQMGTFMCRLSGSCGVAPSVDADTVDGYGAESLTGVGVTTLSGFVARTTTGTLDSFTVTAPADGFILVEVAGTVYQDLDATTNDAATTFASLSLCDAPATTACGTGAVSLYTQDADDTDSTNDTPGVSIAQVFPVTAGEDLTIYLNGSSASFISTWHLYATVTFHAMELTLTP